MYHFHFRHLKTKYLTIVEINAELASEKMVVNWVELALELQQHKRAKKKLKVENLQNPFVPRVEVFAMLEQ